MIDLHALHLPEKGFHGWANNSNDFTAHYWTSTPISPIGNDNCRTNAGPIVVNTIYFTTMAREAIALCGFRARELATNQNEACDICAELTTVPYTWDERTPWEQDLLNWDPEDNEDEDDDNWDDPEGEQEP